MKQNHYSGNRMNNRNDKFWTGLVLIVIGVILFAEKMGANLPPWLFSWPMIFIIIGGISGLKNGFQNTSWLIMMGIGGFFLWDEVVDNVNLKPFLWPVLLIGCGLVFILKPRKNNRFENKKWSGFTDDSVEGFSTDDTSFGEDRLNSTSIFGGVKKVITSKNFKGGEIICIMGGAEINLSQADITGKVFIEITQAFGAVKLVVPPHWEIRTETVSIFAGVEDKRPPLPGSFDPTKVLILKGTTIFGGIEIKSF